MSFPSGPCKHITWLKARVAMPWPSSCIGNEAGVAEFQPIEREFLRASTTSSRAFHARYTRRLGIPTTEFLKPRSQCTKLAVVCTNDVTVTSRSFVRWPEQRYTRAGGSVDFVREIVFPCPEETFSRPAAIRCATTIPVVLTRCSLLDRERIFSRFEPRSIEYPRPRCKIYTFDLSGSYDHYRTRCGIVGIIIVMRHHPIPAPSYNRIIRNINLPNCKASSVRDYNRVAFPISSRSWKQQKW